MVYPKWKGLILCENIKELKFKKPVAQTNIMPDFTLYGKAYMFKLEYTDEGRITAN